MPDAFKSYKTASGKSVYETLSQRYGGERVAASLGKELYREATGIMESSRGLVPVDTGALRSSGYVKPPEQEGNRITVYLGYGGPAAQINPKSGQSTDGYALYVHENLDAVHKVGTAKYLEMPFDQAKSGMGNRIAVNMANDLRGGVAGAASQGDFED